MNRVHIIQKVIDATRARRYLEIGVYNASVFFQIKARRKVAVDPEYLIGKKKRLRWMLKNPTNVTARFHRLTSDDYFAKAAPDRPFDVIFIDGFHTYRQSLKDVGNSLAVLAENGVVVLHDCNPPNRRAARPVASYEEAKHLGLPEWCGDVWKTIVHLRALRGDLSVLVFDCDYGVGVIRRGSAEPGLELTEEEVERMDYDDLERKRSELLNLKSPDYLTALLADLSPTPNRGSPR